MNSLNHSLVLPNSSLPQTPTALSSLPAAQQPSSNSLSSRSAAINWRATAGYVAVATVAVAVAAAFFAEAAIAGVAFLVSTTAAALLHSYRVYQLNNTNKQLTQERDTARGDATQLSQRNTELADERSEILTWAQGVQTDNVQIRERNAQILERNDALDQEKNQLALEKNALIRENSRLITVNISLAEQIQAASTTLGQLQPQLNQLTLKNAELVNHLQQMEQNNLGLTDQIEQAKQQVMTDKLNHSGNERLNQALKTGQSQQKIEELEGQLAIAKQLAEQSQLKVTDLEKKLTEKTNELAPPQSQPSAKEVELQAEIVKLTAERDGLVEQVDTQLKDIIQFGILIDELKTKLKSQEYFDALQLNLPVLKASVEQVSTVNNELDKTNLTLLKQRDTLKEEVKGKQDELAKLEEQIKAGQLNALNLVNINNNDAVATPSLEKTVLLEKEVESLHKSEETEKSEGSSENAPPPDHAPNVEDLNESVGSGKSTEFENNSRTSTPVNNPPPALETENTQSEKSNSAPTTPILGKTSMPPAHEKNLLGSEDETEGSGSRTLTNESSSPEQTKETDVINLSVEN